MKRERIIAGMLMSIFPKGRPMLCVRLESKERNAIKKGTMKKVTQEKEIIQKRTEEHSLR